MALHPWTPNPRCTQPCQLGGCCGSQSEGGIVLPLPWLLPEGRDPGRAGAVAASSSLPGQMGACWVAVGLAGTEADGLGEEGCGDSGGFACGQQDLVRPLRLNSGQVRLCSEQGPLPRSESSRAPRHHPSIRPLCAQKVARRPGPSSRSGDRAR